MKARYIRYREFMRLRHSTKARAWLARQAKRLGLTAKQVFNRLLRDFGMSTAEVASMHEVTPQELPANSPPAMIVRPYAVGHVVQGEVIKCNPGQWASEGEVTFMYRWFARDVATGNVTKSEWMSRDTATLNRPDARDMWWEVEAKNEHGSTFVSSHPVRVHPEVTGEVPQLTKDPVVSGEYKTGETLFCTEGEWTGYPAEFNFWWFDANTEKQISSYSSPVYLLDTSDIDRKIYCKVVAKNPNGENVHMTAAGDPVVLVENPPVLTKLPRYLLAGSDKLVCDMPPEKDYNYTFQWKVNGLAVPYTGNPLVLTQEMLYSLVECRISATDAAGKTGSIISTPFYIDAIPPNFERKGALE